jgi:deoxyribonuclease V
MSISDHIESWKATQRALRERLITTPLSPLPRYVAGADAAFSKDKTTVYAAAVVYDSETQQVVEVAHASAPVTVPYVPGFLSFREGPAVRAAIEKLKHPFGVICFDGQGIAHPRRCGLATHLGVSLDLPSIGVAKSRLIGTFTEPQPARGSSAPLMDKAEQIGLVLRTKDNTRPLFISVGHRVDLASAAQLTLGCLTRYRVPGPTRQADIEVAKLKRNAGG